MFARPLLLATCVSFTAAWAMAEEMATSFGPTVGERVPPLESVTDKSTKNVCQRNMGVD